MAVSRLERIGVWLLLAFSLVHALVTWEVRDRIVTGYPDFTIFYSAATIVRRGWAARLYDAHTQYIIQQEFVKAIAAGRGLLPFNHPPYEALLFVPFTYLSYLKAYAVWAVLNLLIFLATLRLLRPYFPLLRRLTWGRGLILAAGFFPTFAALFEGQDSMLVLLLYALAFIDSKRQHPLRAGAWLALALFKFQLVLPFIAIALLTRRWKLVSGFAITASLLVLANIALVGWRGALQYVTFVKRLEQTKAGGAIVPVSMPNLHGLVDAVMRSSFSPVASFAVSFVLSLAVLFLVASAISAHSSGFQHDDLCFSLSVIAAVLLSYHCFAYDWTPLLLPAFVSLEHLESLPSIKSWSERILLASVAALFISPLYLVPLVRFGHLYGLAIVLLAWGWAVMRQLQKHSDTRDVFENNQTALASV